MLVMMSYTFLQGAAGRAAYARFAHWSPSAGFEIKGGWTSANNEGGFLLLEVADAAALLSFSAQFKDLNAEIDVMPVVELADGIGIVQKAYEWVDSVS
jgi:hypothetical protein